MIWFKKVTNKSANYTRTKWKDDTFILHFSLYNNNYTDKYIKLIRPVLTYNATITMTDWHKI